MCSPAGALAELVQRKGFPVKCVNSRNMLTAAARFGIRTDMTVLSGCEKDGHEKLPASEAAQAAVDEVWGWLTKYNLANGAEKPVVGCFRDVMDAGTRTLGFCDETGVYIADDQGSARSKPLLKTALEECVHWVTRAGDASRDLQDLGFRMIVEILG
jgi:hypothetical protein